LATSAGNEAEVWANMFWNSFGSEILSVSRAVIVRSDSFFGTGGQGTPGNSRFQNDANAPVWSMWIDIRSGGDGGHDVEVVPIALERVHPVGIQD
jgi:hypothetical protein